MTYKTATAGDLKRVADRLTAPYRETTETDIAEIRRVIAGLTDRVEADHLQIKALEKLVKEQRQLIESAGLFYATKHTAQIARMDVLMNRLDREVAAREAAEARTKQQIAKSEARVMKQMRTVLAKFAGLENAQ